MAAGAIVLALFVFFWLRRPAQYDPESLMARLPQGGAVLSIDFVALRETGALQLFAAKTVDEEPEYRRFVADSGFDYKRDLDRALVAFHPEGKFFFLRGRFDWAKLEAYARQQGGSCFRTLCRLQGSQPDRRISFFPLRKDWMAMAVSSDDFGASRLSEEPKVRPVLPPGPSQPVWLYLSPEALQHTDQFPEGTQLFAKAIGGAQWATLALGPRSSGEGYAAYLDVSCKSTQQAGAVVTALRKITNVLKELIRQEKQTPDPSDLSGVLTSGAFQQKGTRVEGIWPIQRSFLDAIGSGGQ